VTCIFKSWQDRYIVKPLSIDTPVGIVELRVFETTVPETGNVKHEQKAEIWFHRKAFLFDKYPITAESTLVKKCINEEYWFATQYATEIAYFFQNDYVPNATKLLKRYRKRGSQHWFPRKAFGSVVNDDGITEDLKYKLLLLVVPSSILEGKEEAKTS